jgi:hypothetical protein
VTALAIGDSVWSSRFGFGEVTDAWGVFRACKVCFLETRREECERCGSATLLVSGRGIYEVRFGRELRPQSVHAETLTLVRAAPVKPVPLAEQVAAETRKKWRVRRARARRLAGRLARRAA